MNSNTSRLVRQTLDTIVDLLVRGEYQTIVDLSDGHRLTSDQIEGAIAEFGCNLIFPPADAFEKPDIIYVNGTDPARYSVRFQLYTAEEGPSDLEIQLTLIDRLDSRTNLLCFEVDNILVA